MSRFVLLSALLVACGPGAGADPFVDGEIPFTPVRPELPETRTVAPYTGSDPFVLDAQARLRTGNDVHLKLIRRSCSGVDGVCHNRKEYPDMRTGAGFLDLVAAPCNLQPGDWAGVYDRCERLGDRFRFGDPAFREIEIGWMEHVLGEPPDYDAADTTPDATSPGLHLVLHDPVPLEAGRYYTQGEFIRTFVTGGNVENIVFARFETRWWILDGNRVYAEVRDYQADRLNQLLAVGIEQGDLNRNGVFGARDGLPVALIDPGNPEESYLVARLRGRMLGERIPGTRMPLANEPPSIAEMLALMCFIEGLAPGEIPSLDWPIDYASCTYSVDPQSLNLLGEGATWSGRVQPVLQTNCGGCHGGTKPEMALDLTAPDAHGRLLQASAQKPAQNLIEPGVPSQSYMWLKLIGDPSIEGSAMPIDPLDGNRTLSADEMDDIEAWIRAGALND